MNPLIMNSEEILRWYEPKNAVEAHLLNLLAAECESRYIKIHPKYNPDSMIIKEVTND